MTIETVALDLEQVLADTKSVAFELSDEFDDSWRGTWFTTERPDLLEHFVRVTEEAWKEHYDEIPLIDEQSSEWTKMLNTDFDVDIVTNLHDCDYAAQQWLDLHDIHYNEFRSFHAEFDKSALDYDVFVDDNPNMMGTVDLHYLFDRALNQPELDVFQRNMSDDILYWDITDVPVQKSANDGRSEVVRVYDIGDAYMDLVRRVVGAEVVV